MTFQRTFAIEELGEHNDRYVMKVIGSTPGRLHAPVKMSFLLAQDQFERVRFDSPVIFSMSKPAEAIVCFEGKVTGRAKGDRFHAFDFQVGPDGQKQFGTLDIDEDAFRALGVGTPLYLYVPERLDDAASIGGSLYARNVTVGSLQPKTTNWLDEQIKARTVGVPHHWRFELTLDDAATVPFQQLCRLGLLIGRSGGEIADGQFATDAEMTTMLVRGPGVAPPDALFIWCKDNAVTCAVRADG